MNLDAIQRQASKVLKRAQTVQNPTGYAEAVLVLVECVRRADEVLANLENQEEAYVDHYTISSIDAYRAARAKLDAGGEGDLSAL